MKRAGGVFKRNPTPLYTDEQGRVEEKPTSFLCDSCKNYAFCDDRKVYRRPTSSWCGEYTQEKQ